MHLNNINILLRNALRPNSDRISIDVHFSSNLFWLSLPPSHGTYKKLDWLPLPLPLVILMPTHSTIAPPNTHANPANPADEQPTLHLFAFSVKVFQ